MNTDQTEARPTSTIELADDILTKFARGESLGNVPADRRETVVIGSILLAIASELHDLRTLLESMTSTGTDYDGAFMRALRTHSLE